MGELLASNPGLASRLTTQVDFPSYSADELAEIAYGVFESQGDVLGEDAAGELEACCRRVVDGGLVDELGNARFARELCRKSGALRDLLLDELHGDPSTPTREEITTVRFADISQAYQELRAGTAGTG